MGVKNQHIKATHFISSSHLILQTCCPTGVENLACMPTLSLSLTIFSPQRTQLALLLGEDSSLSNFLRLPPGDTGGLFVFHNGLFQLLMVIVVAWVRAAKANSLDHTSTLFNLQRGAAALPFFCNDYVLDTSYTGSTVVKNLFCEKLYSVKSCYNHSIFTFPSVIDLYLYLHFVRNEGQTQDR